MNNQKSFVAQLVICLLCLVGAIAVTIGATLEGMPVLTNKVPEFSDVLAESGEGKLPRGYVKMKVDALVDIYATYTERHYFITRKSDFYIAWLDDDSFITVTVPEGHDSDVLDEIIDDTWDYATGVTNVLTDKSVEYYGFVQPLVDQANELYDERLEECGIDKNENLVRRQMVKCTTNVKRDVWTGILFGVGLMVAIIIWFVSILVKNGKASAQTVAPSTGLDGVNF